MERGGRQRHARKTQRAPSAILTECAMQNAISPAVRTKHGAHGRSDSVPLFMLCVVPLATQEVSIE
ncbi:bsr6111 [Bradyrhizobium diazoefficiens USDA 110]|uniref:Bsr6111 protein n=1 Tax=Bradyrhizobium diazoefficiens (strain JCM 10833 / BCRC 13528 / IAM 13628 / NBRC 14792 / USDA 110) TaxID=224911 RepID=Q89H83_BRADU|nr:hypothetical protein Bdiaspc4_32215 [Bradyrhizobium diazoefficiens]BAC51376.1 bsr6111 [Bradyrhizobium diazoefficiens USDA 110]